jgi:hypothetical protein
MMALGVNHGTRRVAPRQSILVLSYSGPNGGVCCLGFNGFEGQWFGVAANADETSTVVVISGSQIDVGEVGTSGRMSINRKQRALALGALLASALALGGCSISIADLPLVGTPADAPGRPKEAGAYLPVNELPPDRDEAAMDPTQRAKIQKELLAARDHQAAVTAAKEQSANSASK